MDNNQQDNEDADQIRTAGEVARRCIVLYAVIAAGHSNPRDQLVAWLKRENLWGAVSPKESEFLSCETPARQQIINATWRSEALYPLVWSLGLVPNLSLPQKICDVQLIRSVLPPILAPIAGFIATAELRSDSEIHDANETIYQIHWHVRDAQIRKEPTPPRQITPNGPPGIRSASGIVQRRRRPRTPSCPQLADRLLPTGMG